MSEPLRIEALQRAIDFARGDVSATADAIFQTATSFYAFLMGADEPPAGNEEPAKPKRGRKPAVAADTVSENDGSAQSVSSTDAGATPTASSGEVEPDGASATRPTSEAATSQPGSDSGAGPTATASAASEPPSDELKTAAMKYSQANGHDAFVKALDKYSATKLSQVPVDQRAALLADLLPPVTGGAFD